MKGGKERVSGRAENPSGPELDDAANTFSVNHIISFGFSGVDHKGTALIALSLLRNNFDVRQR